MGTINLKHRSGKIKKSDGQLRLQYSFPIILFSCPAERVPADRAWDLHVAGEAGQGAPTPGAHHDRHRHPPLQQGMWQGRRRH